MTALASRALGAPVIARASLLLGLAGLSAAAGASVPLIQEDLATPSIFGGLWATAGVIGLVFVGWAVIRFGHRTVATLFLYACGLGLALPAARVTEWMTVSDVCLLAAGVLLVPEISNPRPRSPIQRGFAWAVTLIVIGGLLGTLVAEDARLSLLNLARLVVAAGATLLVFTLWAPSASELRRFLILVVLSGLVTGIWALTHAGSDFGRPSGFSGHPNHLALVSLIAIGPAIAFSLGWASRRASRLAAGGAIAILVGAIVVSGSRAGVVGLAVGVVVAALLVRRIAARAQLAMGGVAIAVAALVGFSALTTENAISRTFNTKSKSALESDRGRRVAFSEMTDQIRQKPVTGVGFSTPLGGHDAYLQLWAAGGVFAFVGGLFVMGSAGAAAGRLRRRSPMRSVHDASWPTFASTISLSGLVVALAFQNGLWNRYIWVAVALVAVSSAVSDTADRSLGAEPSE